MVQQINQKNEELMLEALAISKKALPGCLPNPPVGAIIVSENQIIAKGYTQSPGENHAEIMALEDLPSNYQADNCSIYVTLEPCCFEGKTPACTERILKSGIKSVYVGIIDPDPRNNGEGINQLINAGINVEYNIARDQCQEFLSAYLKS